MIPWKKLQKNPLVKQLGKKALTYALKLYKYGTSKVKNKTARKILNSAAAEQLLDKVASYGQMASGNGISNVDIENFFKNEK